MNRDMMQGFELFQPVQIKDALKILDKYEEKKLGLCWRKGLLGLV